MSQARPLQVLFVCLGNICRSPTAAAVFRHQVERAGWHGQLRCTSAGTAGWHVGKPADARSRDHARDRGYDLSSHRARQLCDQDFVDFDWVIAMDADNLAAIRQWRARVPQARAQVARLLDFLPAAPAGESAVAGAAMNVPVDVPDPYYGGAEGFETVLDLVEAAVNGLLRQLLRQQGVAGCGC